ncbi:MAG: hypothetical protein AAGC68_16105 [Verrucomicrobiota bacterium]
MKSLLPSESIDSVVPSLHRSAAISERLGRIALATPENPVVFEHVAEAGQPLYVAATIDAWRAAGNADGAVWVVCSHVKSQEVTHAEIRVWGQDSRFLPEYEWAGFEESLPDPESAAERLAVLKDIHEETESGSGVVVVLTEEAITEQAPNPGALNRNTAPLRAG